MNRLDAVGQVNGQLITRRPRCIETDACVYRIGYRRLCPATASGRRDGRKNRRDQLLLFRGGGAALEVLDGLGVRCAPFFAGGGVGVVLLEDKSVRIEESMCYYLECA